MFGFRHIPDGPIVDWINNRWFAITIRLRRQRVLGVACSGFADLIIDERIIFTNLGERFYKGKVKPRNQAILKKDMGFLT